MTPPVSAWRDESTASSRVNESKLSRPSCGSPGRLFTGVRTKRYWRYWPNSSRSRLSGPEIESRGSNLLTNAKPLPKPGHEVVGLDDPLVGAALGAHLRDARREAAVLGRERVRQHLDRFDRAARQLEIEVAGGRIVQAGAAHLQRAGRRRAALDAQPALGTADDARQHRQQRLEVVAGERLDVHLRAGQHVADRDRLQALGRRVGGHDDVDALAHERQPHLDQHLLGLARRCTSNGADSASAKPVADRASTT